MSSDPDDSRPIRPDWIQPGRPLDHDQARVLTALLGMQRRSWEQGVTGHALLDLGRYDLVRVLARDAVARPRFDRPGVSAEAQAFFLLATAAAGRFAG